MQRTTLSTPSSEEVTITGRSRSCEIVHELLEHLKAVHLRHLDVEQTRSNASRRSISSATRPFSAVTARCPISSRLRASRSRLTLLSSTTSSRAPPCCPHACLSSVSAGATVVHTPPRAASSALPFALRSRRRARRSSRRLRHRAEPERAEGVAVRLERVRGAAETLRVARRRARCAARPASRGASPRKVSTSSRTKSAPAVVLRSSKVATIDDRCLPCQRLPRAGTCVQRLDQALDADRLGDVIVHAGGEAHVAVALHRVGRHGDDARPFAPAIARRSSRAASSPSISGICTSIKHDVVDLALHRFDRLDAVRREVGAVAHLLQETQRELLIDDVVLGEQDAQRMPYGHLGIEPRGHGCAER